MSVIVSRANSPAADSAVLDLVIEESGATELIDADLRRLFPGSTLTDVRFDRLHDWPRVIVRLDDVPVGVATYMQFGGETRIPDFELHIPSGIQAGRAGLERRVLHALLDAIELASIAGGCWRIVLIPPLVAAAHLERCGYVGIREGCAGAWMEKSLL